MKSSRNYIGVTNTCGTQFVASGQKPDVDDLIRKSATTSRVGGMRRAPWKGPGPPLLVAADF